MIIDNYVKVRFIHDSISFSMNYTWIRLIIIISLKKHLKIIEKNV